MAFPVRDLWAPENLEAFHRDVVAIDPGVTGTPIMIQRSVDAMRRGFVVALGYAALVVVLFVAIDLRRPRALALALLPVLLGLTWTAGLASLIGLRPNLANFFAVPMLIGIAVDNGVHLIHRWLEDPATNPAVGTTGAAIVLTGVTNIVGLGALAFASHRGLASLGLLLALGTGVCVVSALVVVPPLLRRWAR
jgi:predicted RND superfamily exporter protein